jgi:GTP-binding nuclear protein Ran
MESTKIKVIIVGDGGVGKTVFVNRHRTGEFTKNYVATMGVDVNPLLFSTTEGLVVLNIWDCAGQEKFSHLGPAYYKDAQAAIIMFDVGSRTSYKNLNYWYNEVSKIAPDIPIVICGNKCDIQERKVFPRDITFHRFHNLQYYDISAKSNYYYEKPFLYLIQKVLGSDDTQFALDLPRFRQ